MSIMGMGVERPQLGGDLGGDHVTGRAVQTIEAFEAHP
jgi:hypothetical protein